MLSWGKFQKFVNASSKEHAVYVEGYLKTRSWEGENGARLYRTEIVVQDILVLDRGIRHDANNGQGGMEYDSFDDIDDFGSEVKNLLYILKKVFENTSKEEMLHKQMFR